MEVTLRSVRQEDMPLIKPWLIAKENAKWLAPFFQNESMRDEQLALFLMRRDKLTLLVLCDGVGVGVVGLTSIDAVNRTAELWGVIGDPAYRRKGVSKLSYILIFQKAFFELKLHSVCGWVVDGNFPISTLGKLGFTCIGRQRECHLQGGVFKDRLGFDILDREFEASLFARQTGQI
jgi:RimJ/RimL family protein N-acetyltransferase